MIFQSFEWSIFCELLVYISGCAISPVVGTFKVIHISIISALISDVEGTYGNPFTLPLSLIKNLFLIVFIFRQGDASSKVI